MARVFLIANSYQLTADKVAEINRTYTIGPDDLVVRFNGKECPSWRVFPGKTTHVAWRANRDGFWGIGRDGHGWSGLPTDRTVTAVAVAGHAGQRRHAALLDRMRGIYGAIEIVHPMQVPGRRPGARMSLSTGATMWRVMRERHPDAPIYAVGFTFCCHDGAYERRLLAADPLTTVVA